MYHHRFFKKEYLDIAGFPDLNRTICNCGIGFSNKAGSGDVVLVIRKYKVGNSFKTGRQHSYIIFTCALTLDSRHFTNVQSVRKTTFIPRYFGSIGLSRKMSHRNILRKDIQKVE